MYRYLEHTADVYVEVVSDTLESAFEDAGKAVYNIMTDISRVRGSEEFLLEVEGFDLESLLYNWIEELLFIHDFYGYFLSEFKVFRINRLGDGFRLCAVVYGERYDPDRHTRLTYVKSPTYSQMEIILGKKVTLRFVVDI